MTRSSRRATPVGQRRLPGRPGRPSYPVDRHLVDDEMGDDDVVQTPDADDLAPANWVATSTPGSATRRHPRDLREGRGDGRRLRTARSTCTGWAVTGPALLGLLGLALDMEVVDGDVDLGDLKTGHALDPADHVAADRLGDLHDALPVVGDHVQVDRGFAARRPRPTPWLTAGR